MPVYHKQQAAQLIQTAHKIGRIVANVLRHIPCLYQELHSCDIEYLANTGLCSCLYSAQQLFRILLELIHVYVGNRRPVICSLSHGSIATLPINILLGLLGDIEHVAFWLIAVRTFQGVL